VFDTGSHGIGSHPPDVLQRWPAGHEPQLPPQPSVPHTRPAQLGAQTPHVFGTPAPPQVSGSVHVPQVTLRPTPHRSVTEIVPQLAPRAVQSSATLSPTQPHRLGINAPHVAGATQLPQATVRVAPQRSVEEIVPQFAPAAEQSIASVCPTQPHWFGSMEPQVDGATQDPHVTVTVTPQRLVVVNEPHAAPAAAHSSAGSSGMHSHVPSAVHSSMVSQAPHVPPQLSGPHSRPPQTGVHLTQRRRASSASWQLEPSGHSRAPGASQSIGRQRPIDAPGGKAHPYPGRQSVCSRHSGTQYTASPSSSPIAVTLPTGHPFRSGRTSGPRERVRARHAPPSHPVGCRLVREYSRKQSPVRQSSGESHGAPTSPPSVEGVVVHRPR